MRNDFTEKKYTTRELLAAIQDASGGGIEIDNERLKDWHRRRIIESDPSGKGNERRYSFREVALIASLALFADRTKNLAIAKQRAHWHAAQMIAYASEPSVPVGKIPGYVIVGNSSPVTVGDEKAMSLVLAYGPAGAVLVHPAQFASQLLSDLEAENHSGDSD